MEWQKSEISEIWYWSDSSLAKAVVHFNLHTSRYDVALIKWIHNGGAGVSAQGFRTLEAAQEWVRLMR